MGALSWIKWIESKIVPGLSVSFLTSFHKPFVLGQRCNTTKMNTGEGNIYNGQKYIIVPEIFS